MNASLKKALRTLQVNFPYLLDAKFAVMRLYRQALQRAHEDDFDALTLFPDEPGLLFLDVGGNRGQSTDAILMKTKRSHIYIYEPNPFLFEKLKMRYGGNERVTLHGYGLGDQTTEQLLYIPYYKRWMFDGLASYDESSAREWLRGRLFFYHERHLHVKQEKTSIKRLDDLQVTPFFVKLDIQGYELKALRGGENTLRAYEPILLVESPGSDIVEFLKGLGYRSYAFRGGEFICDACGSLNTFFMTESKSVCIQERIVPKRP